MGEGTHVPLCMLAYVAHMNNNHLMEGAVQGDPHREVMCMVMISREDTAYQ